MSCFGEGGGLQGVNASCLSWASQNSAVMPIFWTWISSTLDLAFTDGPRDGPQAKGSSHQCRETWLQDSTQEELAGPTTAPRAPPISLPPPTPPQVPRYGGRRRPWHSVTGALESKSGFVRGMDQFSQRFYPLQWLPRELEMIHRAQVRPSVSRRDGFVIAVARAELLRSGFRRVPVSKVSLCVCCQMSRVCRPVA